MTNWQYICAHKKEFESRGIIKDRCLYYYFWYERFLALCTKYEKNVAIALITEQGISERSMYRVIKFMEYDY